MARAPLRPTFLRSTMRGSRVRKPAFLRLSRRSGLALISARLMPWRIAGLPAQTAATYIHQNVHVAAGLGQFQGLTNRHLEGFQTEILVQIALVDQNLTVAGDQTDTGDGRLTTSHGIVLNFRHFVSLLPCPYLMTSVSGC